MTMILIEIVRTELWVIEIPPKATLSFENIAGTDLGEEVNNTKHKFSRSKLTARAVIN